MKSERVSACFVCSNNEKMIYFCGIIIDLNLSFRFVEDSANSPNKFVTCVVLGIRWACVERVTVVVMTPTSPLKK